MEDANKKRAYQKLHDNLEDMVKIYRQLLEIVRKEKDILIEAKAESVEETSYAKDTLLTKARAMDALRVRYAEEMAGMVSGDTENPRLLEIAQKLGGNEGEKLRSIHSTLELLIKRITDFNTENETLAKNAIKALNGQMTEIKETITGKTSYEKKGQVKLGPSKAGNFVSREA